MIDVLLANLERLFGWLLTASWQGSVVALLVLLLQSTLRRRLNPRWSYALWLLVLFRLVIPVLPPSALSIFQFTPAPPISLVASVTEPWHEVPPALSQQFVGGAVGPMVVPSYPFSSFTLLALVWVAGALVLLVVTLRVNDRFARQVANSPAVSDPHLLRLFADARTELRIRRSIALIESQQVQSPAIMGLFRPTLLLPTRVRERFDDVELRLVFLHELAHLKRGDILVQGLIAFLQILHWFNPVLWFAFRRMRIDREPATDALVLSRTGESEKERYGLMLIKLLEHFNQRHSIPTLVGILEDKDQFKRRFSLIARFTRGAYGWSLLGIVLIVALAIAFLTDRHARKIDPALYQFLSPQQTLFRAVKEGDAPMVKKMLDQGISVNLLGGPDSDFPLYAAVDFNRLVIVKLLISRGADVNQKTSWGDPAVYRACWLGEKDIADALVKAGAKRKDLTYFAGTDDVQGLKEMQARKPLTQGYVHDGIGFAAASGSEDTFNWLYGKLDPMGAKDKEGFFGWLYDMTARGGHINMLRRLEALDDSSPNFDKIALSSAIVWSRIDLVKYLTKKLGSHPTLQPDDGSLLFEAQNPDMAEFLINQGIDVNARNRNGVTALMMICRSSWNPAETALVLLQHGADPNAHDKWGTTALHWAREDPATTAELIKFGAQTVALNVTWIEVDESAYQQDHQAMDDALSHGDTQYFYNKKGCLPVAGHAALSEERYFSMGNVTADVASATMEKAADGKMHAVLNATATFEGINADFSSIQWNANEAVLDSTWSVTEPVGFKDASWSPDVQKAEKDLPKQLPQFHTAVVVDKGWHAMPDREHAFWIPGTAGELHLILQGQASMDKLISAQRPSRIAVFVSLALQETSAVQKSIVPTISLVPPEGVVAAPVLSPSDRAAKLLEVVRKGDAATAQKLIDQGADPKALDQHGRTLLFDAGSPEVAELLVAHGVDPKIRDQSNETALSSLCLNGGKDTAAIARVLLRHGADPNSRGGGLKTTPIMGARDGHIVDVLVQFGADLKAVDSEGESALYWSTWQDISTFEALLRHGFPFDPKIDGPTILLHSTWNHNLPLVTWLLAHGVDPNSAGVWATNHGQPDMMLPIVATAISDQPEAAKILLEHRATGNAAMALALQNHDNDVVKILWEHGVRNISELTYDISQNAPLRDLEKILQSGALVDPPQDTVITPLGEAAETDNFPAVQLLVQHGADVNKGGNPVVKHPEYRDTPLVLAAQRGQDGIVAFLLEHGAQANPDAVSGAANAGIPNDFYAGKDHLPSKDHYERVIQALIDAGALKHVTPEWSGRVLVQAMSPCWGDPNPKVLQMLLAAGLNPEMPMPELAERGEKPNSVIGYFRDAYQKNKDNPANAARQAALKPLLEMLEAADRDASTSTKTSSAPVTLATQMTSSLPAPTLPPGPTAEEMKAVEDSQTPLIRALRKRHYDQARTLLAQGADCNATDRMGLGPLAALVDNSARNIPFPIDLFETILSRTRDPNPPVPLEFCTPPMSDLLLDVAFMSAAYSNQPERMVDDRQIVKLLLAHGARFSSVPTDVQALLQAAALGDLPTVQKLLSNGTSPNAADGEGWTPLLVSVALDHDDVADWLVDHGANVNVPTRRGAEDPLTYAAVRGNDDLTEKLIAHGAKTDLAWRGLERAIDRNDQRLFDDLITAGVDMKDAGQINGSANGKTWRQIISEPLFTCIKNGQTAMAKTLLDKGVEAEPEGVENDQNYAYWAVYYDRPEILRALLDHGANPLLKDRMGDTPLSLAQKSHPDLIPMLKAPPQK